jgi:hypothetical protein
VAIDYVSINQKITDIDTDTPVYRGIGIHSDHFLVLAKISLSKAANK